MVIVCMREHSIIRLIQRNSELAGILREQPVSAGIQEHLFTSELDKKA